jgi:ring-1,2-phenylacetyl-CoA epoxidase subunit PaaD
MVTAGARAWAVAAAVRDPELPFLTLADLGILRHVASGGAGTVVTVTPTYAGCPAITELKRELHDRLTAAGLGPVEIRTALAPPWSSEWITAEGREKLRGAGVAPPAPVERVDGTVPVSLVPRPVAVACPQCGSQDTVGVSAFGPTPCTALRRCRECREPFEHVKAI